MAKELLAAGRAAVTPAAARRTASWLLPALVTFFFLTGISGLIYQVLWLRLLALVFGVTIWAASTVLASFMAGLAIGSFAAGKLVDRARSPLLWYGAAEVLVGVFALATPLLLHLVERLYVHLYPVLPHALGPLTAVRFVLSFAVLVLPTTLMGATLPIIVKSSLLRAEGLGERVSLLYATNTAGAIAGTLLAGFWLVGGIGIDASFRLAAAINVLVGVAASLAALTLRSTATEPDQAEPRPRADTRLQPPPSSRGLGYPLAGPADRAIDTSAPMGTAVARSGTTPSAGISEGARRLVLLVFTLSGFTSLALEVIWFRVLVLFLDVTTYAFTLMLATFLAGIAAGSYLVTPLMRRLGARPGAALTALAILELLIALVSVLSLTLLGQTYDVMAALEALLRRPGYPLGAGQTGLMFVASFLAVFPATLLMGIAFPVGLALYAGRDENEQTGERIGVFYACNVLGAILGSVVAGFLLLPALGSTGSLVAVSAVTLLAGLFLLGADRAPLWPTFSGGRVPRYPLRMPQIVGTVASILFVLAAIHVPDPFGVVLQHRFPGERLLWREEGIQTTVSVNEQPEGYRAMYLDGLHQANDSRDMVFLHRLIGTLPMALHHDPKEALVIGLGGGVTGRGVAEFDDARVEVVELAGSVIRGSDWFRDVNGDVTRRPNVTMREDDGRNYLLLTPKRYDVITADIIQPIHAGAGNLYSVEYFRLARNALKDDGLMLQWIGPQSETQYKLIMRTFLEVFPDTTLWFEGSLMVGSKRPLQLDPADFDRKLADPQTRAVLEEMGFPSFMSLFSVYWAGPQELKQYVGPGPILTDDQPLVEYFRSLPRNEPPRDITNVRGDALQHVKP